MAEIKTSNYNAAADAAVRHLRAAATWEPRVQRNGYKSSGLREVVTSDSLERYIKANKIRGDEADAIRQAFVTLAGRQSEGEDLTVVATTKLRPLARTLKGFAATHNDAPKGKLSDAEQADFGKTAKALVKGMDELRARDFGRVRTEKEFSQQVDLVLEHLLVKANTGNPYLNIGELARYTRGDGISDGLKDALWKSFRYIGRTMSYGETNNQQICMDQRAEAHRILMKLFAGNSGTRRAIAQLDV